MLLTGGVSGSIIAVLFVKRSPPAEKDPGGPPFEARQGGRIFPMPTIHIHADESGDLRFDRAGSRYFTFAAAWTYDPAPLAASLQELRFSLLRDGNNLERFHAANDRPWCRNAVFRELTARQDWNFAALVVDKGRLFSDFRDPLRFYPRFMPAVLTFILKGRLRPRTDRILIYTDRLPVERKKKAVEKAIHQSCVSCVKDGIRFHMYHHDSASNAWLQVADYCCWAVHRKYEHHDSTYYDQLRSHLAAPELYLWR